MWTSHQLRSHHHNTTQLCPFFLTPEMLWSQTVDCVRKTSRSQFRPPTRVTKGESVKGNSCRDSSRLHYFRKRLPSQEEENTRAYLQELQLNLEEKQTYVLYLSHLFIKLSGPSMPTEDRGMFPSAIDREYMNKTASKLGVRGRFWIGICFSLFENLKLH